MGQVNVVAKLSVALTADGRVLIVEAVLPNLSMALAMLEQAKLDINHIMRQKEKEDADRVVEVPPPGWKPDDAPAG